MATTQKISIKLDHSKMRVALNIRGSSGNLGGETPHRRTQTELPWYSKKRPTCNKSVDILQQLVTTSRYQDAFPWFATACGNNSVLICQQACCNLSTGLLQVDYFNRRLATCFDKL